RNGGAGKNYSISGSSIGYAGGGGGGAYDSAFGTASHGGGAGSRQLTSPSAAVAGTANTGGGGGGAWNTTPAAGGSGVVIINYPFSTSTSPNSLSLSTDTTTKMEGSGALKAQIGAPQVDANTVALWHMDETAAAVASPVTTYSYTGVAQTFTAPSTATYKIETWGAQGGGTETSRGVGGLGGYAYGNVTLNANDVLNIYVGGSPGTSSSWVAAWNGSGGGCGPYGTYNGGAAGGGASDVRQGGTALANRIIVAGGGGGGGAGSSAGGAGGGATGSNGTGQCNATPDGCKYGAGGTQSAGGAGGNGPSGHPGPSLF
ncbi:MAG: glycine rich domain-containing protein, partial [Patescibacteria group bacterium]